MKRKSLLFLLLFALLVPWAANAQNAHVVVGDGTTTNNNVPISIYYNYSYSQQIYTAEQINEECNYVGDINSISFYYASSTEKTFPVTVFMKTTEKAEFASTTDWETVTADDIVYEGDMTVSAPGWVTIAFENAFAYDGQSNLLIAINKGYYSNYANVNWRHTGGITNQSLYARNDSNAYDPYTPPTGTRTGYLANIMFNMTLPYPAPTDLAYENVTPSTTNLTWAAPVSESTVTGYAYQYKKASEEEWSAEETLTSTSATLNTLEGATAYNFKVKAFYGANESCYANIDFTTIDPCSAPTDLEVSEITHNSAVLSWTPGYDETAWTVRYKKMADTDYSEPITVTGTPTYAFDGIELEGNTTYYVLIAPDCDENKTLSGNFKTKDPCAAPTNLVSSDVTVSSVTLSWTPGYQETEWTLKYKKSADSWDDATEVPVSGTPTTALSGLDGLTTYNVRVYNCAEGSYLSGNFTTAASFPYFQDFSNSGIPTGWTQYSGLLANIMAGTATLTSTTYGWSNGTSNGVLDGNHIYANIYSTGCTKWIATPSIPVENGARLAFDVAYTAFSGTAANPATDGTDDKFVVLISTDNMATWTILRQWDNAGSEFVLNELTPAIATQVFDLADYAGQNVVVAFYAESTVSNADNNIHVDNVAFELVPTCDKPTELAAIPSTTSAVLSWTAGGTETAWTVYYKKTTDEAYTEMPNATNPYTLNGLEAATAYQYYVVANCSETEASAPSAVFNFITECEAYAIPYTYDFEDGASFTCWNPISGNVTRFNSSYNAHGGTYYLDFRGTTSNMIALPQFSEETSTLAIEFWTRPESTGGNSGKFAVGYMTDLNDANTFVAIETYNSTEMTTTYVQKTVYFTGAPAGAYIAMRQFDCSTSWYWFVDDITVMEAPTCLTPTNLAASNITGHTAELSWTAGGEETAWQICINRDETNLIDVTTNPYTLPELAPETEYIVMVRANCGEEDGVSAWSNEVVFTTDVACPAPTALTVSNVTPIGATISWEGSAESYTLRYKAASGFNYGFEQAEPWAVDNFPPCTTYDGDQTQTYAFDGATFTNIPYTGACIAFQSQTGNMSSHNGNAFGLMISAVPGEEAPVQNNDWFILPELTIAEGDIFSFWGREITDQYGDEIINVGVYGSTEGTFASLLAEELAISGTEWTLYSYDLSAYAGQTIRLAINYISTDVFGFMFDDIFVGNPNAAEWDEIITDATSPYVMSGLTAETVYDVEVQANCGEEGNSEWVASSFTTLSLCNAISELTVTNVSGTGATLNWTGFMDSYNVRYRTAEDADILFFEDFSNGIGDWTTENLNASSGIYENSWFRFHWTTTPPQYLISPELEGVVSGTTLQFVYAAPSTSWTETFQVGVSSTDNSIDSFTWGEEISTVNNQGQYYVTELPEGTKYFAIKCTSDDQFYLYVTNFLVFANHVEAGEWVELNGVTSPLAIPGLTPGTWYEWQVQGVDCGEYWFDGEAFQTLSSINQTIELTAGWNWVSTYIDLDGVDAITLIEEALGDNGMTIATFDDAAVNLGGGMWFGLEGYTLSNSEMIMIEVAEDCSFTLEGPAVDPSTITITINPEWNWIGFPVANETSINDALAGFAAEFEDQIANFTGATVNFGDWIGDFETLVPGQGYMYFYNGTEPQDLIFQTGAKSRSIISNLSKPMKVTNNNTVEKNSLMNKSIKGTK